MIREPYGKRPPKIPPKEDVTTEIETSPPLTYEGYVGTGVGSQNYNAGVGYITGAYESAVGAANTNKELGYNYAQGVKDSIYASAEQLRTDTDQKTEAARQRGIIDSQSSYQKALGTYGANAEALGSMGLTGGGYGEYLAGNAYATHRGQVQDINAGALKANRESAALEQQTKQAADSEYLKAIYGIDTTYNQDIAAADAAKNKGLYEISVGLDTSRANAYGSLLAGAQTGASLDSIKNDERWGDLTPEQQAQVIAAAEKYTTDTKNEKATKLYETWLTGINNGTLTPSQIRANPDYNNYIKGTDMETALNNAFTSGGLAYITSREDQNEGAFSKSDVESYLRDAGYTTDIDKIIEKWQESNFKSYSEASDLRESDIARAEKLGTITSKQAQQLREKLPTKSETPGQTQEPTVGDTEWARGEKTSEEYVEENVANGTGSAYATNGWCIRNLGTGIKGDLVSINIGSTTYDENTRYKLESTGPVSEDVARALNTYLSDNGQGAPSTKGESLFGTADLSSEDGKGSKLIVYEGKMYLYTKKGWVELVDRKTGETPNEAIAVYLNGGSKSKK